MTTTAPRSTRSRDRRRGTAPLDDLAARRRIAATRDAQPFDREAAAPFAEEGYGDLMPADSRHLLPVDRGVVARAGTIPPASTTAPSRSSSRQQRSPLLDYDYSPIGKLLDEASLATLDRSSRGTPGATTCSRPAPNDEERDVADLLQAPVKIVKVLVYEDGKLVRAGPGRADEGAGRSRRGHPRRPEAGRVPRGSPEAAGPPGACEDAAAIPTSPAIRRAWTDPARDGAD